MAERLADVLQVAPDERAAFIKAARAELAADQVVLATQPLTPAATASSQPSAPLPSGTVTFLFTDIAGSTQLWEQHPQTMPAALARHDALLRQQIVAHGGVVFKTIGDAFCAAFATAPDALAATLALLRALAAETWEATGPLRVRVALHTGAAETRDGDYFGPALNRTARLLAAGHGGQVLLSLATEELVRERLPPNAALRDLGSHRLRDLSHPERIFQLICPDLPADFPPLRALATRATKLPVQPNALIGRERELDALHALLRRNLDGRKGADVRLVTLTGPGGMGKTRLALALAEQSLAAERFPDGVCFVALAPLTAPEHIVPALADALDFPLDAGKQRARSPRQQVLDYLREKRLLLILDNVEHLLGEADPGDDAANLVASLLDAAPHLAILATSRERLSLREEHNYPLRGLEVPGTAALDSYGAVTLFMERARLLRPEFAPTSADLAVVAHICRLVDGLPLAIELAAGWVDTLALSDIATEIERGLDLLASALRDAPARHRSMRAVFDGSWRRLGAVEQTAFARLSVFRGGSARRAVQHVSGATLPQLQALVGASLLSYDATRERYTVHELLRQYTAEQLARDVEDEWATRDRHAAYYCALLRDLRTDLQGARQRQALEAIEADGENARAAWDWAAQRQQAALLDQALASLGHYYEWQGRAEEGVAAFRAAAQALAGSPSLDARRVRARLLAWQSAYTFILGDHVTAEALLAQSEELLDGAEQAGVDARAERAFVLLQAGLHVVDRDSATARAAFERSRALFEKIGDRWGEAAALSGMGFLYLNLLGDYDLAQQYLEQSLVLRRALDDRLGIVETLTNLSNTARYLGRVAESERLAREGYTLALSLGNRQAIARAAGNLGMALSWSGDYAEAYGLLQETATIYADLGDRLNLANAYARLGMSEMLLNRYADARATLERGLKLARGMGAVIEVGFCLDLLATVALAEGAYTEARSLVAEAIPPLTAVGERWFLSDMLIQSALAERGLGNRQQARQQTVAGLRLALEIRGLVPALCSLRTAALLLADDAELEHAVELDTLAQRETPFSQIAWEAALWGRELAAVAAGLPADVVAAAQARGRARDLWATARELLAELEARGWDAGAAELDSNSM
jgi:predicted ATPase/class 3 adenylate cyclase